MGNEYHKFPLLRSFMAPKGWKDHIPTQIGPHELSYHLLLRCSHLFFLLAALPAFTYQVKYTTPHL